jgi:hypothetical protein
VEDTGSYAFLLLALLGLVIALMLVALPLGVVLATPLWRRNEGMLGNLAGTVVIFGTAIVLILKESSESDALASVCLEAGLTNCFPSSNPFTRYAIYAFIGLAEVIALFLISLAAERRIRDRDMAPEWRRWGSR